MPEKLTDLLGTVVAFGMAGSSGVNLPAISDDGSPSESHLQAITLALGQLFVVLAFVGVSVYLLAIGRTVDGQLWTLDVSMVSFYIGQRVNLVKTT